MKYETKDQLFDAITRNKQRNQSNCDQMKNLNIRSEIISRVINERTKSTPEHELIVIDCSYKCKWYSYYKAFNIDELCMMYEGLLKQYIKLSNLVKVRSKRIMKMRDIMKYGFKNKWVSGW